MEILAVIPARSGSQGIKNKNIRPLAGRPLIAHAIADAQGSKYITRIIVSTDSPDYARIARRYGAEVPFLRPKDLAGGETQIADVIWHLLKKLQADENYYPDYLVLLQATSPLRTVEDVDGTIELLFKRKAKVAVTVCDTEQLLYTKDAADRLKLVSRKEFLKSSNRQDLPPTYRLDGPMVYFIETKEFLKRRSFIKGDLVGYVIPVWRAIDLDEPQDFVVGEALRRNFKNLKNKIKNFK